MTKAKYRDGPVYQEFVESAPINPDNAFTCANCGSFSTVYDSRPHKARGFTSLRRRRVCNACGYRWTTIEVRTNYLEGISGLSSRLAAVRNHLRDLLRAIERVKTDDQS